VRRKLAAAGNDARGQPQPSRLLPLGKGGSPILVEVLIMMRDVVSINASLRGKHRNIVPADAVHRPASRAVRPLAVKAARYSILHARSLYHGKENSKSPVLWTQATYGVRSSGVPGAPLRTRPSPPKVHRAPAPPRSARGTHGYGSMRVRTGRERGCSPTTVAEKASSFLTSSTEPSRRPNVG
jgi:hypothetical protein